MFKLLTSRSKINKKGLLAEQNNQVNQKESGYENNYYQGNRGQNYKGKPLPTSPAHKNNHSNNPDNKDDMTSVLNNLPPLKSSNVQFTQFSPASAYRSPKAQTKLLGKQGKKVPFTHQLQNLLVPPTEKDKRRLTTFRPPNRDSSLDEVQEMSYEPPYRSPGHRISAPSISTAYHEKGNLKKYESHEANPDNYHPNLSKSPFSKRASRLELLSPKMYEAPKELEDESNASQNIRKPLPHKPSFGRALISEGMERQYSEGTPKLERFGEPMRPSVSNPVPSPSVQRTSQKPRWKFLEEMRKESSSTNQPEATKKNSSPLSQPPLVNSNPSNKPVVSSENTPVKENIIEVKPDNSISSHPSKSKREKSLDAKVMLAAGMAAKENETRSLRRFVQAAEVQQRSRLRKELNATGEEIKSEVKVNNLVESKADSCFTGSVKYGVKIEGSLKSRSNAKIEAEAKDYFKNEPWLHNLITAEIKSGSNSSKNGPDSTELKPKLDETFKDLPTSSPQQASPQSKSNNSRPKSKLNLNSTRWAKNRASNSNLKDLAGSQTTTAENPVIVNESESSRLTPKKMGSMIWNRSLSKVLKPQEEIPAPEQKKPTQANTDSNTILDNDSDDDEVLVAVRRRCLTQHSGNLADLVDLPPASGRDPSLPIPRTKKTVAQIRSMEPLASSSSIRLLQSKRKEEGVRPKTVVENLRSRFEMKILEAGSTPKSDRGLVESASMSNLKSAVVPKPTSRSKFTNIINRPKTMFDIHSFNPMSEPVNMARNQLSMNLDEVTNTNEDPSSKMALAWKASAISNRNDNKDDEKMSLPGLTLIESLESPGKDNSPGKLNSALSNPWKSKSPLDDKFPASIFDMNSHTNRDGFKPTQITVNRVSIPNSELNLTANGSPTYQTELSEAKMQIENWKKKYRDEQFAKETMEASYNEKRERELSMHLEEVENIKNVCSRRCRELIHVIRELQELNVSYSQALEKHGIHPQLIQPADPKLLQEPVIDPLFAPKVKPVQAESAKPADSLDTLYENVQDNYDARQIQNHVSQSSPSSRRKNSETASFVITSPSSNTNYVSLKKKQVGSLTPITMYKFIEEQYKKIVQNPVTSPLQTSLKVPSPSIKLSTIRDSTSDLDINQIGESFKLSEPINGAGSSNPTNHSKVENTETKKDQSGRSRVKDRIASLLSSIERTATAIEFEASHLGLNASGHSLKRPSSTASILSLKAKAEGAQANEQATEPRNRYSSTSPRLQLSPMRSFPTLSIHSVASARSSSEIPAPAIPSPPTKTSSLQPRVEPGSSPAPLNHPTSGQSDETAAYTPINEPIDLSGLQKSLKAVAARSTTNFKVTTPIVHRADGNKPIPPTKASHRQAAATMRNPQPTTDLESEFDAQPHSPSSFYLASRTTPRVRSGESEEVGLSRKPLPKLPPQVNPNHT